MKRIALLVVLAVVSLGVLGVSRTALSQNGPDGGCFANMPCCPAFPDAGLLYCNGTLQCLSAATDGGAASCQASTCNTAFAPCCLGGTGPATNYCTGAANGVPLQCYPAGTPITPGPIGPVNMPYPYCR